MAMAICVLPVPVPPTRTAGQCGEVECERRSREFQDAIFGRRIANPLILPLIYRFMRPELERRMQAGADALLKQYAAER
jgi:SMODS-associating 4TM effector domain